MDHAKVDLRSPRLTVWYPQVTLPGRIEPHKDKLRRLVGVATRSRGNALIPHAYTGMCYPDMHIINTDVVARRLDWKIGDHGMAAHTTCTVCGHDIHHQRR